MDNETFMLLGLLAVGLVWVALRRKAAQDSEALFWQTVCEPLCYVMDDPFDDTAAERHAHALEMLEKHGNVLLRKEDVWLYTFRADATTPTGDFSRWREEVVLLECRRREAWRAQKAGWNADAARQMFAGQKAASTFEWDGSLSGDN